MKKSVKVFSLLIINSYANKKEYLRKKETNYFQT